MTVDVFLGEDYPDGRNRPSSKRDTIQSRKYERSLYNTVEVFPTYLFTKFYINDIKNK